MMKTDRLDGANVLLTGATGVIGGEILRRLLQTTASRLYCLIRKTNGTVPGERIRSRLGLKDSGFSDSERIVPVVGDLTRTRLGISPEIYSELQENVNIVIHCAAETSFIRNKSCQDVNIAGLESLLELVATFRHSDLFVYIGSAAICGDRHDAFLHEDDYPAPLDRHFNPYTKSKAQAEDLLRNQDFISDWLILRPSIVIPDNTLDSALARQILWAIILMTEIRFLPLNYHSNIDVIPLSFVGECTIRLLRKPELKHNCYHISAGLDSCVMWGNVISTIKEVFNQDREIECLNISEWIKKRENLSIHEQKYLRLISPYFQFINQNVIFDNQRLYFELSDPTPEIKHFRSYLPRLLRMISIEEAIRESANP